MPDDVVLDGLLLRWEEQWERGEDLSPEELCRACPELLGPLRRRIAALRALAPVLDLPYDEVAGTLPPAAWPALPDYEILGVLAHGGMGVVYKARDRSLDRVVALKVPRSAPLLGERAELRFQQEARVLARLTHEHIVPVYEARLHAGRPYFAMQFVPGGNLAEQRRRFAEDPHAAAALMEKVARAVHHAHEHGVLHRDLKPANILLDEQGKPWVSDFGLALHTAAPAGAPAGRAGTPSDRLTEPGGRPGTLPYMAPEQLDGDGESLTPAADVWALGVILYELLTGRRPFPGPTAPELRDQICTEPPPAPRQSAPRLSRRLERVVLRCLEKDPRRRYPSAGAVADALVACRPWRPRWGWAAALGVMAVIALAAYVAPRDRGAGPAVAAVDPYQRYRDGVTPVLDLLKRGQEVELVPPAEGEAADGAGPLPPHYVRGSEGATQVSRAREGLNLYANAFGLVELLPEVPLKRYRVIAVLKHDACHHTANGLVGLYCRGSHARSSAAQFHLMQMVEFNDVVSKEVWLARFRLYCLALRNGPLVDGPPQSPRAYDPNNKRAKYSYPPLAPTEPRPWRTITLDVEEGQTVARWGAAENGGDFTFGPLSPANHARFVASLRRPPSQGEWMPDFREIDDSQLVPQSLGVAVFHGRCLVQSLRVVPLAADGPL